MVTGTRVSILVRPGKFTIRQSERLVCQSPFSYHLRQRPHRVIHDVVPGASIPRTRVHHRARSGSYLQLEDAQRRSPSVAIRASGTDQIAAPKTGCRTIAARATRHLRKK